MGYCENADVRAMLKDDALNTIIGTDYIGDPDERESKILPLISAAITDAGAEIDGYLAKRYPLPLSHVPQALNKFAKDIAVYNLYSRIGINEGDREKNILNRYKAAVRFLELVADGTVSIGTPDPATAAHAGFKVDSPPRVFGRDKLSGM